MKERHDGVPPSECMAHIEQAHLSVSKVISLLAAEFMHRKGGNGVDTGKVDSAIGHISAFTMKDVHENGGEVLLWSTLVNLSLYVWAYAAIQSGVLLIGFDVDVAQSHNIVTKYADRLGVVDRDAITTPGQTSWRSLEVTDKTNAVFIGENDYNYNPFAFALNEIVGLIFSGSTSHSLSKASTIKTVIIATLMPGHILRRTFMETCKKLVIKMVSLAHNVFLTGTRSTKRVDAISEEGKYSILGYIGVWGYMKVDEHVIQGIESQTKTDREKARVTGPRG
ncbi:uncharacterized protein ACA1_121470 [Acanthamoeba castellanii str. Neff]|uniref:Uncharacterized protein n=1 Tax=Acanthamoeba castellanii (strain ATCC 30010 / Neff) TaxID=1257118 RepID=L8GEY7_ACACF|nr:uncharacterized protein ACA1_121470 [Acanthamoeba castellanii str. Neff]ELR11439.1 hypothetical protein ACA1_121470 [Acanthamoeba castellanii str. Neff]